MIGHCPCVATGLSSHAIARAFGHCRSGGSDHPWDPSDLRRCRDYCRSTGISDTMLAERMPQVSPQWAALIPAWPELLQLLADEEPTGNAPRTYQRMKELLDESRRLGDSQKDSNDGEGADD